MAIKNRIGVLFLIFLISGLLLGSFAALSVIIYGTLIVEGPLLLAQSMVYLNLIRGTKEIEIMDVFNGFRDNNFIRSFVASLLMLLYIFLWSLLLVIPGIIKALAYSMTYYILSDNPEMGAQDAMRKSEELMRGHKSDLFILYLSFIPWCLLVPITGGLILIFLAPYAQATFASYYDYLKNSDVKTIKA